MKDLSAPTAHKRADIQGLRALAVLSVICFHAGLPLPGGFTGVDVFFVISGFVITQLLLRSLTAGNGLRFASFYARRFKRLTPALSAMVTVTVMLSAASVLFISPFAGQERTAQTAIGAMLLVANLVLATTTGGYFDQPAKTNPLLNTWSLSVEEQFYLVFPLALAGAWFIARRWLPQRGRPLILVAVVALGSSSLVLALLSSPVGGMLTGFYSPLTRAWEFAAGAIVAILMTQPLRARIMGEVLGVLGIVGVIASWFLINDEVRFPGPWTLLPVLSCAAVIIGASHTGTLAYRLLSTRPLVRVGDWSYSLYLWHWPIIVFAIMALPAVPGIGLLGAAISVPIAVASFALVEDPLRRAQGLTPRQWRILVASALTPPLVLGGTLWLALAQGFWNHEVRSLRDAITIPHASNFEACSIQRRLADPESLLCDWNTAATGRPIYLIGDSTADHLTEAMIIAGQDLDRPLRVVILPACTFRDLYQDSRVVVPWRDPRGCRAVYDEAMRWLSEQEPGLALISELNSGYRDPDAGFGQTEQSITFDEEVKHQVLEAGLTSTITTLHRWGYEVALVQAVPSFEGSQDFYAHLCSLPDVLSRSCNQIMSLEEANRFQSAERSSLARVARTTSVTIIDPRSIFCPEGTCTTENDGVYLYRDRMHLSVAGSRFLAPLFTDAIERIS